MILIFGLYLQFPRDAPHPGGGVAPRRHGRGDRARVAARGGLAGLALQRGRAPAGRLRGRVRAGPRRRQAAQAAHRGRALLHVGRDQPRARRRLRVRAVLPARRHPVHEPAQHPPRAAQLHAAAAAGGGGGRAGALARRAGAHAVAAVRVRRGARGRRGGARRAGGPARAGALLRRLGPHAAARGRRAGHAGPALPHAGGEYYIVCAYVIHRTKI